MGGSDFLAVIGIVVAVLLFLLGIIGGLIAFIFRQYVRTAEQRFAQMDARIRENGRHLDSIAVSAWGLIWKYDHIAEFLEHHFNYQAVQPPIPPLPEDD